MSGWVDTLREAIARTSQAGVARELQAASGNGYPSESLVSQVVRGLYDGRTERLQALVEGVYEARTVVCPVLDSITRDRCWYYQTADWNPTNHLRVQLYRACRTCQHRHREDHR